MGGHLASAWTAIAGSARQAGASQILRRNTFRYCGVEGIGGMGTTNTLIEDNLIEWCGWADAERGWEAAGAKFHRAHNMLFRRNVIRHIRHGNAVWFDSGNVNCRLTSNVFADILTVGAAVHMEMNRAPNQIDNNIIWNVRNAEPGTPGQRGCAGSGIFINASDHLNIAQNLIGRCDNSGIFAITRPDRAAAEPHSTTISPNNIFASAENQPSSSSARRTRPTEIFMSPCRTVSGVLHGGFEAVPRLAAWREAHGWDKNSVVADAHIDFDPDTLQLTISMSEPFPKAPAVNQIEVDILESSRVAQEFLAHWRIPGPGVPGSLIPAKRSGDQKSQEWNTPFLGSVITGNRDSQLLRLAS